MPQVCERGCLRGAEFESSFCTDIQTLASDGDPVVLTMPIIPVDIDDASSNIIKPYVA